MTNPTLSFQLAALDGQLEAVPASHSPDRGRGRGGLGDFRFPELQDSSVSVVSLSASSEVSGHQKGEAAARRFPKP